MPPRRQAIQDQGLFEAARHEGAYGPVDTYRLTTELLPPSSHIEVVDESDKRARKLGEFAVSTAPRTELETKQERFKEKFADKPWVPRSQYELTLALQTMPVAIGHIAEKMPRLNQPTARNMYESAQNYYYQSSRALIELDDAFVLEGDKDPSISKIRNDFSIRSMIAEHLLAKESFKALKWLPKKTGRSNPRERRLQVLVRELELKPSVELLKDWNDAHVSAIHGSEFWRDQLEKVQKHPRVVEIQSENIKRRI